MNILTKLLTTFCAFLLCNYLSAQVITKTAPATADTGLGEVFTYTVNYTCPSTVSGDCDNVIISDILPSGIEYINGTVGSIYDINSGEVSINLGTVPNGGTRSLQINVRFLPNTLDGTEVVNTATVNYTQVSPESEASNPVTTTATNGVVIGFNDNLQVSKSSSGKLIDGVLNRIRYDITYGNESSSPQTGFTIEDVLPLGMYLDLIAFANNDICVPAVPYELYVQVIDKNTGITSWQLYYTDLDGGPYYCPTAGCDFSSLSLTADQYVNGVRVVFTGTIPGDGCFNQNNPSESLLLQLTVEYDEAVTGITDPVVGDEFVNCVDVSSNELPTVQDCQTDAVQEPTANPQASKADRTNTGPYEPGEVVAFRIVGGSTPDTGLPLINPTYIDILPPEMEYLGITSINFLNDPAEFTINPGSTSNQPVITSEILPDDRTKITYNWDDALGNGLTIAPANFSYIQIEYEVRIKVTAPDMAILTNEFYSSYDTPVTSCSGSFIDVDDIDGDGDVTERLCNSNIGIAILYSPGFAGLNSYKEVQGNLDAEYSRFPSSGEVSPGGNINYNICLENPANLTEPINDIVIVDVLPHIGDRGVVANDEFRETEWRPEFTATTISDLAANLPAGSTIYYSTECNPCLNADLGSSDALGCTAPAWSTTAPANPNDVCAFKVVFPPAYTLTPGDVPTCFQFNMTAPTNVSTNGEIAWNSFGYVGEKSDNSALLASEPIKVGIRSLPPVCTNPTVTAYTLPPSCTNGIPNNDGYLQISAATDATHYNFIAGSDYTSGDTDINNATAFDSATDLPLEFGTLANPTDSAQYTIRVFNTESDCYTDITVTLMEQDCTTGCNCEEMIYLNEPGGGTIASAVHKFSINTDGSLVEIGMPWFDNAAAAETLDNPHGLGVDLNGFLYIAESGANGANIRKFNCEGEIFPTSEFSFSTGGVTNIISDGNSIYYNSRDNATLGDFVQINTCTQTQVARVDFCDPLFGGRTASGGIGFDWGFYKDPITDVLYATSLYHSFGSTMYLAVFSLSDFDNDISTCITPIELSGVVGRSAGVTTDRDGNIYIVTNSTNFTNCSALSKFSPAPDYNYLGTSATDCTGGAPDFGYNDAIGIVYSETSDKLYVSTMSLSDDCVSLFDKDLNYLGSSVPSPGTGSSSKGIAINKECCPNPLRQTIDETYCEAIVGDKLFLNEMFPCDGIVCGAPWVADIGNTGVTYDACDQSITIIDANTCATFTKKGANDQCGAFDLTFNVEILQAPSISMSADQTICSNETPTELSVTTTATNIQWQMSTTSCTDGFTDIAGATAATYQPAALTDTTYYRTVIIETGNCSTGNCNIESDCITVSVNPNPTLAIDGATCDAGNATYTIDFTSDATVTSNAGTVAGNQVIDVPAGTDATITAELNGCTIQETVVSPTCGPDCPPVKCMRVILNKN